MESSYLLNTESGLSKSELKLLIKSMDKKSGAACAPECKCLLSTYSGRNDYRLVGATTATHAWSQRILTQVLGTIYWMEL